MKVIENTEECNQLIENTRDRKVIVLPIFTDADLHYMNNKVSLIYIKVVGDETYIIPLDHSEAQQTDLPDINPSEIWTDDQTALRSVIKDRPIKDASMYHYLKTNQELFNEDTTMAHMFISRRFPTRPKLNRIIPIVKHVEICDKKAHEIEKVIASQEPDAFETYTETLDVMHEIERVGIRFEMSKLRQYFSDKQDKHLHKDYLFSKYNFYTSTGRPSNRFGNFNFAAIKKEHRDMIIPENDSLMLFDFDSYHLHLIANLIGYDFPERNAHDYLGKQYFQKDTLTEKEHQKAKVTNFKYLYGGAPEEVRNTVPFFKQVEDFSNKLWIDFSRYKFIKSLSGRKIYASSIEYPNPKKVMNYLIQLVETEFNMAVIKDVIKFLSDKKTKLILYTYDSFLFDVSGEDGQDTIEELYKIINVFPVKVQMGWNYADMSDISSKFN